MKGDYFVFVQDKKDSVLFEKEIRIPMVFIKKEDDFGERYLGFIPGFVMKNITATSLEECKSLLLDYLKRRIKAIVANNAELPCFPTEEEIKNDFDDVFLIEFIKIKK